MDIREYFRRLRQAKNDIPGEYAVVVSTDTPDGGKAGRVVEVTRDVAAHMIVDSRGRLATESEIESFRTETASLISKARSEQNSGRIQFAVMSPDHLLAIRQTLLDNPELLQDQDAFLKVHKG